MAQNFIPLPAGHHSAVELSLEDQISVEQVKGGHAVRLHIAPKWSDDLWETVTLPVRYPTALQAQAKVRKIREAGAVDLRRWVWQPSAASSQAFMHYAPIAVWVDAPFRALPFLDA